MKRLALLLVLHICAIVPLLSQTTVNGTVTGADGKPLRLAHVHVMSGRSYIGAPTVESVEVGADGTFSLTVDEPGMYTLGVTGVDHDGVTTPLFVAPGERTLSVELRPGILDFGRDPDSLWVIGDWNEFDFDALEPMKREKDGSWSYTLKTDADSVLYQIIGLTTTGNGGMRSVNGPGADAYVYDGGGDYRSIVRAKSGSVTIRVRPADLPKAVVTDIPPVAYRDKVMQDLVALDAAYNQARSAAIRASMEMSEDETARGEYWQALVERTTGYLADDQPLPLQYYAAIVLAQAADFQSLDDRFIDESTIAAIDKLAPPNSWLWKSSPYPAATFALYRNPADPEKGVMDFIERSTDRTVQAVTLSNYIMTLSMMGASEDVARLYPMLDENYGDVEDVQYTLARLDPDRQIQIGKPVPAFYVTSIDGKSTISNQSLMGRYYLIDFWATWCGPCVMEMPNIHKAYERFAGDNFEIVSLSFDAAPDKVGTFRENKWKMPWLHTFVEGGFESPLAKTFEVQGIPKPILVGPDGTIVATEEDLRGTDLEKTLEKFLGDDVTAR